MTGTMLCNGNKHLMINMEKSIFTKSYVHLPILDKNCNHFSKKNYLSQLSVLYNTDYITAE